jgi:hypothetical protein
MIMTSRLDHSSIHNVNASTTFDKAVLSASPINDTIMLPFSTESESFIDQKVIAFLTFSVLKSHISKIKNKTNSG